MELNYLLTDKADVRFSPDELAEANEWYRNHAKTCGSSIRRIAYCTEAFSDSEREGKTAIITYVKCPGCGHAFKVGGTF